MKRRCHLDIELSQDLVLFPEVVHVALNLLEVTAGDAAGVGQKVGYHENAALLNNLIGIGSGRAVGALGDNLHVLADLVDILAGDLIFDSRRDEDIDILFDPGFTGKNFVTELVALVLSIPPKRSVIVRRAFGIDTISLAE